MMKRTTNETRRHFRGTNNTNITLVKANHAYAVFEVTSNRCGQRTLLKLKTEQLKQIIDIIDEFGYSAMVINYHTIENVLIKHRALTKLDSEPEATYKYFDTKRGVIRFVHCGDQMIITIGERHEMISITANVYDANRALSRLKFLLGEDSMNEWTR